MKEFSVDRGRKLNLAGSKPVGSGYASWVYELDDGNVVKVLKHSGKEDAEREILLAKWAFSNGIPTAISYDVVDVDGRPGLVYESLGRGNLRNAFRDEPERFDEILADYLSLLHTVNEVTDEEAHLPNAKDRYREALKDVACLLTPDEIKATSSLLDTIPDTNHIIHGDCQIKNVRVVNGKLFLIDLDTLSRGDPIFELSSLFCCYRGYPALSDEDIDSFFEISNSTLKRIIKGLIDGYYPGLTRSELELNEQKISLLAWLSMAQYVKNNLTDDLTSLSLMIKNFRSSLNGLTDLRLTQNK